MKYISKLILITVFSISLFSCNKDDANSEELQKSLESDLFMKSTSNSLSEMTFNLGVRQIEPIKNNLNSFNFKLNGEVSNLNGHLFIPNSTELNISKNNNSDIIVSFMNSNNYLKVNSSEIQFSIDNQIFDYNDNNLDNLTSENETELIELIALYNEVTNSNLERTSFNDSQQYLRSGTCAFHALSVRSSRSYAKIKAVAAAEAWIADGHGDCSLVGDVNSGCAWEDFGCVAEQTMECNGASCD